MQAAVLVQLLFDYIAASIFFADDTTSASSNPFDANDDIVGMGLILINSLAMVLALVSGVRGVRRIVLEISEERLRWTADGTAVVLTPPRGKFHLFVRFRFLLIPGPLGGVMHCSCVHCSCVHYP